jgi:hypothetical protein
MSYTIQETHQQYSGSAYQSDLTRKFYDRMKVCQRAVFNVEFTGDRFEVTKAVFDIIGREPLLKISPVPGLVLAEYDDLQVTVYSEAFRSFDSRKRQVNVNLLGSEEQLTAIYRALEPFVPPNSSQVEWFFYAPDGSVTSMTVSLKHMPPPKDEFYPWIKEGVKGLYDEYLESDASILVLLGEAGTGKTSIIRDFIHANELKTAITHDERLMQCDSFFIQFMLGDNRLLVLEDADILMGRREDGNSVMTKLLNTSDGLIKTDKKVILSANLSELDSIDHALVRPGRCHKVIKFRAFTADEARQAAKAAGRPDPGCKCTLAEMFNGPANHPIGKKFGFGK